MSLVVVWCRHGLCSLGSPLVQGYVCDFGATPDPDLEAPEVICGTVGRMLMMGEEHATSQQ